MGMANMLQFSEKDKVTVGLIHKQTQVADSLVGFLLGENDL